MLGHAAIAETAIADVGGVLQVASAEMSGIASKTSVGVGILAGVAELSFNNTQTTAGIFISGSVNAELSSNLIQTTENIRIVKEATSELSADLTQTSTGAGTFVGTSSQDLNFTKTSSGDIMFVDVVTDATTETYTEITPSGTETYTEVTPSGTETYTEIVR